MFYRYEVRIGSDKPWEGCFQYFFPDQRRYIGRFLKEPKWYKEHPNVATRCWFTQEGFDKYGELVRETIEKRGVLNDSNGEYRLVKSESLENIVMLGKIQCIQRISMYDIKIPLGMRTEILIERNQLRKEVKKEHITQNQAERFLAEYMLREIHVISGKEAADKQVLSFINDFREDDKSIRQKFCAGYCYYFAVMLKDAFHRGEICWCAPLGHICWVDDNGVPYDIDGVCDSDCNFFIPIRYIREGIEDFRHVPGREFNASREYIQNAIQTFCRDVIANIENKGEKL